MAKDPSTDWPEDEDAQAAAGVTTSPVAPRPKLEPVDLPSADDMTGAPTLAQAKAKASADERSRNEDMQEGWGLSPDTVESIPVNIGNATPTPLPPMDAEAPGEAPAAPMPFGKAFAAARKAGDSTFSWRGKSYSTAVKGAGTKPAAKPASATVTPSPVATDKAAEPAVAEAAAAAAPKARPKPNFFPGNSPDAGKAIYPQYKGEASDKTKADRASLAKNLEGTGSVAEAMNKARANAAAKSGYKGELS